MLKSVGAGSGRSFHFNFTERMIFMAYGVSIASSMSLMTLHYGSRQNGYQVKDREKEKWTCELPAEFVTKYGRVHMFQFVFPECIIDFKDTRQYVRRYTCPVKELSREFMDGYFSLALHLMVVESRPFR